MALLGPFMDGSRYEPWKMQYVRLRTVETHCQIEASLRGPEANWQCQQGARFGSGPSSEPSVTFLESFGQASKL